MDYGEPFEGETDDVRLSRVFGAAGLPVARIFELVPDPGCLIQEDLGDLTVARAVLEEPAQLPRLLERAVTLAVEVAVRGTPALAQSERAVGPALDAARFRFEMDFFLEHYVSGLLERERPVPELRSKLHRLADRAAESPRKALCHRDFHSRNLMLPPGGGLAMVDIQDARWGPDTYDLASLLYDAYVDIPDDLRDRGRESFRAALPDPPPRPGFESRLRLVATQRMIKALGTFGYQASTRGRRGYLSSVPRTLARLETLLPDLGGDFRLFESFQAAGLFVLPSSD